MALQAVREEAEIPSPALVIDTVIADRNIQAMAKYTHGCGLALRPHSKTHKSIEMGRRQVAAGAVGLTVAKAGEAEVMAQATNDLLVAYPALDPFRANRIAELAKTCTVRVAVDSLLACDSLAQAAQTAQVTLKLLVDLDVGFHRTGVQTAQQALELSQHIDQTSGISVDGLFSFFGHIIAAPQHQEDELAQIEAQIRAVIDHLHHHGIEATTVSGGSTPTAFQSHLVPSLTEIRPGTYLYYDWISVGEGCCQIEDCAARMICTVISNAVPGKIVLDAGSKTLTSDRHPTNPDMAGYGHICEYPDARITRLSEEHGEVDLSQCDQRPALGERVHVIPNHICPCVNLQDFAWFHDGTSYEPQPIHARGKLT